jgi:DnaK suppressor protein
LCDEAHKDALRERLLAALRALDGEGAARRNDRATVTLDQQSVGRLSRMDAMQRQAMAQATDRRREVERLRIRAALKRLVDGEYGYCAECGDEIAPCRLEADPTVPTCVSCARG